MIVGEQANGGLEQESGPLGGVRVLDLTRLLPGPKCTSYLADLGADVIKIEDTGAGDYARGMSAPPGRPKEGSLPLGGKARGAKGANSGAPDLKDAAAATGVPDRIPMAPFFRAINRSKRSLGVDLKRDEGRAILFRLIRNADVLVESFRPGVMRALGIDYAQIAHVNPRIVYASITGYGQDGPRASMAGHDINYLGYAGVLEQTGARAGPPAISNLQIADLLGGALMPAIAILSGLFDAQRTGRGRYIDLAMTDAVLAHGVFALQALIEQGATAERGEDLLTGGVACYGVYATLDGRFVAVGALEEKFWRVLCITLAREDLIPLGHARGAAGEHARAELGALFKSAPLAHWVERFAGIDCCVTPVATLAEALVDPQFVARGMVEHERDGTPRFGSPFRLNGEGVSGACNPRFDDAPAQGEHSAEILRGAGYDQESIDALVASGVVKIGAGG